MDHFARFGAVVAAAEKVAVMDSSNHEVSPLLCRARGAANAGSIGNELFKVGKYRAAAPYKWP